MSKKSKINSVASRVSNNEWREIPAFPGYKMNREGYVLSPAGNLLNISNKNTNGRYVYFFRCKESNTYSNREFWKLYRSVWGKDCDTSMVKLSQIIKESEELIPKKGPGNDKGVIYTPRKCHDCGKFTYNYRCDACWAKIRANKDVDYLLEPEEVQGGIPGI